MSAAGPPSQRDPETTGSPARAAPPSAFPLPPPPGRDAGPAPDAYRPLGGRARLARRVFWVLIVGNVVGLAAAGMQLVVLSRAETVGVSDGLATVNDSIYGGVGLLQFGILIVAIVLFLRWFSRAYRNARALSPTPPRYGPGWAIGAWFVPILNLWRPKQIANDIWRGSDPELPAEATPNWTGGPLPGVFAVWWAVWIVSNLIDNVSLRATLAAETVEEYVFSTQVDVLSLVVELVAALLVLRVIARTTARQEARAAALGLASPPAGSHEERDETAPAV